MTSTELHIVSEIEVTRGEIHIACCRTADSPGVHRTFCGEVVLSDQVNNHGGSSCAVCKFECEFGDCPDGHDCEVT